MVSHTFARAGSTLRRHTWPLVAAWAAVLAVLVVALLAFAESPTIAAERELIANNSFERGLAPWEETGDAEVERSIEEALVGRASARVEALHEDARYGIKFLSALFHPEAGERFVISVWVKGTGLSVGRRLSIRLDQRGGSAGRSTVARADARVRRAWTRLRATGTIRESNVHDLSVFVYVDDADEGGDVIYIDQASLVRASRGRTDAP